MSLGIFCEDPNKIAKAQQLAARLNLPLIDKKSFELFQHLLVLTPEHLELRRIKPKAVMWVDFVSGPLDYRRRKGHRAGGHEILKAIGGAGQKVLDATGGLARDAFILASLGCQVTAVERSPIVAALVQDGLDRAKGEPKVGEIVERRLRLQEGNSLEVMGENPFAWDVIYLDPMFPTKKKTALPKKEMQLLQEILEETSDDESESVVLLQKARRSASRVVVKRPLRASELEKGVSVSFKGESTRFDVYISNGES